MNISDNVDKLRNWMVYAHISHNLISKIQSPINSISL